MMKDQPISTNPLVQKYMAQRGKVENFLRRVPFLKDALDNKEFLKADQFLRNEIEKHLTEARKRLEQIQSDLLQKGQMAAIDAIEKINKKISQLRGKLESQLSGAAGFGRNLPVATEKLDSLLEYNQMLLEKAEFFLKEIEAFRNTDAIESQTGIWLDYLDSYEKDMAKREEIFR